MEAETERLRIRDLRADDPEAMVALWGDPDVERWMTGFGPRTRSDVERFRAVIDFCFSELGVRRFTAGTALGKMRPHT